MASDSNLSRGGRIDDGQLSTGQKRTREVVKELYRERRGPS